MNIPILSLNEVNVPDQDKAVLFIDKADNKMKALSSNGSSINLVIFEGEQSSSNENPTPSEPSQPEIPEDTNEYYATISGIKGIYSDVDWSLANGNYYKTELEGDVGIAVKDGKVYKNDNGFYLYLDWEMWGTWTIVPNCFANPGASGQGAYYNEQTDEPFNPDGSSLNGTWSNLGSGPSGKLNITKYKA